MLYLEDVGDAPSCSLPDSPYRSGHMLAAAPCLEPFDLHSQRTYGGVQTSCLVGSDGGWAGQELGGLATF